MFTDPVCRYVFSFGGALFVTRHSPLVTALNGCPAGRQSLREIADAKKRASAPARALRSFMTATTSWERDSSNGREIGRGQATLTLPWTKNPSNPAGANRSCPFAGIVSRVTEKPTAPKPCRGYQHFR